MLPVKHSISRRRLNHAAATVVALWATFGCTKKPASPPDAAPVAASKPPPPEDVPPAAAAPEEKVVNLFIWADYTSKPTLEEFTRRTGIKVVESNYSSNEELLAKLQAGATGFDLAVPSDYMVTVMAKLGLLQELDKTKVPNIANLDPHALGKPYDPKNVHSLPYAWTITGIAVNRAVFTDPVTSWGDLLANPAVQGRASVLDDVREVIGAALKLNGFSLNSTDPKELAKAKETLVRAKRGIKAFNASPADILTAGDVVISQMYSGEALVAARTTGKPLEFVIPKEGATLAMDNLVLLKGAPHATAAYALINYFYEPNVNADFVGRVLSGPVVNGVRAMLPKDLQENTTLFPPAEALARCEMMSDLGDFTAEYDRLWAELKASTH